SFLIDRESGRIAFQLTGGAKDASFRSAGYDELLEDEKPILAAERRRLLYVAATRARDLLVLPVPDPEGRPEKEAFLADLQRAGAIPDAGTAGAAPAPPEGSALALPNGARARLERIDVERPTVAEPSLPLEEAIPEEATASLTDWRRERGARLAAASRAPAFLTASGRRETAPEAEEGLAVDAASRVALESDLGET